MDCLAVLGDDFLSLESVSYTCRWIADGVDDGKDVGGDDEGGGGGCGGGGCGDGDDDDYVELWWW